nr:hypothetical protein [Mycoplasmopsis bovis]
MDLEASARLRLLRIFANLINCYHNNDDYTKLCPLCAENENKTIDIIEMDVCI